MKTIILILAVILCYATYAQLRTNDSSATSNLMIILTKSDGQKYKSINNGYSWERFSIDRIIKLEKADGERYISYDYGYSYKSYVDVELMEKSTTEPFSIRTYHEQLLVISEKTHDGSFIFIVFDLLGNRLIERSMSFDNTNEFFINIANFKRGYYIVVINNGLLKFSTSFIKY